MLSHKARMAMHRAGFQRQPFKTFVRLTKKKRFRPFRSKVTRDFFNGRTFNIEKKFHDVDIDDTAIANTGTIVLDSCNKIPQGVTEVTRVGRKATIKQINWRFEVRLPTQTAAASASDVARIILYHDKQANGATAAVTDLLETANYQSFNNLANKSRFRTLMDRTYDLVSQAGGGDGTAEDYGQVIISDTLFKKVNIPIEYNSTAGAITEITSNNIGLLTISRSGLAAFASKMRLRFTDL